MICPTDATPAPPFQAVLFDTEGTLFRRTGGSALEKDLEGFRRAHRILTESGLPLPDLRTAFGLVHQQLSRARAGLAYGNFREISIPALVHAFVAKAFPDAPEDPVEKALEAWYEPHAASVRALPGAREALLAARDRGWKIAASGNTAWGSRYLERDLEHAGLSDLPDAVLGSADAGYRKPNLLLFQQALDRLETPGTKTLHVGDDPKEDLEAPQEMGMTAVLVAPPGSAPRADHTVSCLAELPALLAELAKAER